MKNHNKQWSIGAVLFLVAFLVALIATLAMIIEDAGASAESPPYPDGINPPTITESHTCLGANVVVSQWDTDPSWGDELASEHVISYLLNGELNTQDGDESPAYGTADWLIDKYAHANLVVEVTSTLYQSESPRWTYVEIVEVPFDQTCWSQGNIEDVAKENISTSAHRWGYTTFHKDSGTYLGEFSIVQTEDGTWMCDEVVDVSRLGGLYIDAMQTTCTNTAQGMAQLYMPLIIK